MLLQKRLFQTMALTLCLIFLGGCGGSDGRIGERGYDNYTVSLSRIDYTGKAISSTEIAEFLSENQEEIENTIAWTGVEPVESSDVLNRPTCVVTVGEKQSVLDRSFVYLPVVNREGSLTHLMSLRRTENGLEYGIEGLGVVGESLEKYPDKDLVLVQVPSHLSLCVLTPDNRIFSDASTEMFDPGTNYYDHFKTAENVINIQWYK